MRDENECAYLVRIRAHGNAERASQPEVCKLEVVVDCVDEQILWLEVAVQDTVCMAVEQTRRQLMREFLGVMSAQPLRAKSL